MISDPQLTRIKAIMKTAKFPWYIAGGWSIDLFIGRKSRDHKDMDIVVFREYVQNVLDYFQGWKIGVAVPGEQRLEPVSNLSDVDSPRYCLHITSRSQFVEVLLTDRKNECALYRRNPSISLSLQDFIRTDETGILYITAEWQLLFKSKSPRNIDELDFRAALPYLSKQQKEWLGNAMIQSNGKKEWIELLEVEGDFS